MPTQSARRERSYQVNLDGERGRCELKPINVRAVREENSLAELPGEHGFRPLHHAIFRRHAAVLAFLVDECRADVDSTVTPRTRTETHVKSC